LELAAFISMQSTAEYTHTNVINQLFFFLVKIYDLYSMQYIKHIKRKYLLLHFKV